MEQTELNPPSLPGDGRRRRRRRWVLASSVILALVVIGAALAVWHYRFRTYHFVQVQPGVLYRDGLRTMAEFKTACRLADPRTVVMLVDDEEVGEERFRREMEYCRGKGINVVRIPVPLGTTVKTPRVREFLDVMAEPKNHPVLVHCSEGVRRTGMMVAAYQESVLGYDDDRAKDAILGFDHSPRTTDGVRAFIEYYDPGTKTVNIPRKRDRERLAKSADE